nr:cellulase (EC 3.2.1.4) / cellulose 1,4-beta-cellobiosidase (EC 3.2.1.91) - Caldocellum saccharolyticum (fragments) [Caldicellulosiruptor saccharolyticus]
FMIGVAIPARCLSNDTDKRMVLKHFNSITAENEMKPESLLAGQTSTGLSYRFSTADAFVDFASTNKIGIRGHTLVWHNQTPDWFFKDSNGQRLSKDALLARLKQYIYDVVGRYKGKVYAWDVVNEAIDENQPDSYRRSTWYEICGPEYIEKAFIWAHEADPNAKLFYNDYNTEISKKRDFIYNMVKNLKSKGIPIHGIGMQCHINVNWPSVSEIENSILFSSIPGIEIHITELDMSLYNYGSSENYSTPPQDLLQKQSQKYKEIFTMLKKYKNVVKSVTFWGLKDDYSWLRSFYGKNDWPLLFFEDYSAKPAYWAVIEASGVTTSSPTPTPTPTVTVTPTPTPTPTPGGQIKVLYANKETNSTTNTIRPWLKVVNSGSSSIDLSRVTIRYWYTVDGERAQSAVSDWAQIGASNVTFKFVKLSSSVSGADYYLEIGFKSGAGQLQPGKDTGEIQIRFNKSDWSNYNQGNDWSWLQSMTSYGENEKVTAYIDGVLVWGQEPSTNDDWLYVSGNKIVDKDGRPVWLTGINWFGYNTGTNVFDGVWSCNLKDTLAEIANRGFNLLRVPISAELILNWSQGIYPKPNINYYVNPELEGKNSLEVFDIVVQTCKEVGLKIMLDIHSIKTDAMGHIYPVWYDEKFTPEDFYKACEWITNRYKNDDTIIAFDLKNEPHGKPWQDTTFAKWDNSTDINNWKYAAETCAKRILNINPNLLIVIEGIEAYPKDDVTWTSKSSSDYYSTWWGGNLRGVRKYPINLGKYQNKVVYSPHDYGPSVYQQPWFYPGFTKESLLQDCWRPNWAYIMEENIAPLLIGEWGGHLDGADNEKWMKYLRDYIIENHIHHTFWCFNANSGDTGGLVGYDFTTWDEKKYSFLKPALWQDSQGRFVGLDHKRPLGTNGKNINITTYYNNNEPEPVPASK